MASRPGPEGGHADIPGAGAGAAAAAILAAAACAARAYTNRLVRGPRGSGRARGLAGLLRQWHRSKRRPQATATVFAARHRLSCMLRLAAGLAAGPRQAYAWKDVWVTDYGATTFVENALPCTAAFQKAVADIASTGSGILRVPAGVFFVGPFNLTSNMVLWLSSGTRIYADTDRERLQLLQGLPSYGPSWGPRAPVRTDWRSAIPRYQPLIYGKDLVNVTVTGQNGSIDGLGSIWWSRWLEEPLFGRPGIVQFDNCTGVRIENVTLQNPGFWCVHIYMSQYVEVRYLTILVDYEPQVRPTNTDGVNPDSSSHVLIEDSYLQTGDDSIAIKSGWDCFGRQVGVPSHNITIRRVTFRMTRGNYAAGVAVGSEMSAGVENVLVEDCIFIHTGVAVEVKVGLVRGGYVRNVHARNITVGATNRAAMVVMAQYPEQNPFCSDIHPPAPQVSDVTYEQVYVEGPTQGPLVHLQGAREVLLTDITVRGVVAKQQYGMWICDQVTGLATDNVPHGCLALRPGANRGVGAAYSDEERHGSGAAYNGDGAGASGGVGSPASPGEPRIAGSPALPGGALGERTHQTGGTMGARIASAVSKLSEEDVRKLRMQSFWRNDGRCGRAYPAENSLAARCPTTMQFLWEHRLPWRATAETWLQDAPCCGMSGWCGSEALHCLNVDYRQVGTPPWSAWVYEYLSKTETPNDVLTGAAGAASQSLSLPEPPANAGYQAGGAAQPGISELDPVTEVWEDDDPRLRLTRSGRQQRPYPALGFVENDDPWTGAGIYLWPTGHGIVLIGILMSLRCMTRRRVTDGMKTLGFVGLLLCMATFGILAPMSVTSSSGADGASSRISGDVPFGRISPQPKLRALDTWRGGDNPLCSRGTTVSPMDFGAKGDGVAEDSDGVLRALQYGGTCGGEVLIGPRGRTFMVAPGRINVSINNVTVNFVGRLAGPAIESWNRNLESWPRGSCAYSEVNCSRSDDRLQSPEYARSRWTLLHLYNSSDVMIVGSGGGGLRAAGYSFWPVRNIRPDVMGYCLLKLERTRNIMVDGLELVDSPMYQLVVMESQNVSLSNLRLSIRSDQLGDFGPHNTDGVCVIASQDVFLRDSFISSGDDNVVVKEGSRNVVGERLTILRGKGISIGSLGERATEEPVEDVHFRDIIMDSSMHGARIKTWLGGKGLIRNVTFQNFKLRRVALGFLIDQQYCPLSQRPEGCASEAGSALNITDVAFQSFSGTFLRAPQAVSCYRCSNVRYADLQMRPAQGLMRPAQGLAYQPQTSLQEPLQESAYSPHRL